MTEEIDSINIESVEIYPLDVRSLRKGQYLGPDAVQKITGVKQDHPHYLFAVLQLREYIVKESQRLGSPLSIATHNGGIQVNTDEQAVQYHHKLAKDAARAIFRHQGMLRIAVDVRNLSDKSKQDYDRKLTLWGSKIAALKLKSSDD